MVLDQHRDRIDWWLVPLAKALRGVHPNHVTWLSLVASIGAGVSFWQSGPDRLGFLALGAALVFLNGVLDVLDGKIAKITGKTSPKGDYLDHAIDRFSDVAFLGGLTFSPWVSVELGLAAIVTTLLTSYLGTQAQAVGIGRNYGGLLGRADRLMLLMIVPWIVFGLETAGKTWPTQGPWNLLEWMFVYFAAMGLVTTLQRFLGGLSAFDADGRLRDQP